MNAQIIVTCVRTNAIFSGEIVDISPDEYESTFQSIKESLTNMSYIQLKDMIIPGNFLRNECVLQFRKEE